MDQAFYIGAVGAHQQLRHLNIQGDNIANVNTQGYKANKARFINLMYQKDERTAGDPQDKGVGTKVMMTGNDFSQGPAAETGRSLDYMIEGRGFFAVKDLATDEIRYTRNGAFKMARLLRETGQAGANGQGVQEYAYFLSDGQGRLVLDQNEDVIRLVAGKMDGLELDGEGYYILDESGEKVRYYDPKDENLPIGIFDFQNYDGMIDLDGTYYSPVEKNGDPEQGSGNLICRYLESSNMDLAEALTKVIEAQRAYGLALKVVQTSDEVESTINGLRG